MTSPSPADLRAFVRRHTRPTPVTDLPGIRLQTADDVARLSRAATVELGLADADLPYWAFPWAGGLALARHIATHPEEVSGRDVVDVGTGSGLCAIAAARSGASSVRAFDLDPLSQAAVAVNARANRVRIAFTLGDPLDGPPPACDVLLAGDVCYQETMAGRMLAWLRDAASRGIVVLVGDPGRAYLPLGMRRIAAYEVRTTRELEDAEVKESAVYLLAPTGGARR
jgi:predicted nicotinamide N-methyase